MILSSKYRVKDGTTGRHLNRHAIACNQVWNYCVATQREATVAKSVLDAGWTMLRNRLRYKASRHGARYVEADERFTSQTCSCCGSIPDSSPKGMGALGVRHWVCSDCGEAHDRDVNAARNILRVGLERQPPAVEIPALYGGEDVNFPPPTCV